MTHDMRDRIAQIIGKTLIEGDSCLDAADAIIAALPDMVPELEWEYFEYAYQSEGNIYFGYEGVEGFQLMYQNHRGVSDLGFFCTLEETKAAANAHHRAQIMAAFGIAPAGIAQEGET